MILLVEDEAISRYAFAQVLRLHGHEVIEAADGRSEEHTSELQSQSNLVCRLLLEKKKIKIVSYMIALSAPSPNFLPTDISITLPPSHSVPTTVPSSAAQTDDRREHGLTESVVLAH